MNVLKLPKIEKLTILFFLLCLYPDLEAQEHKSIQQINLLFYNVENLFDVENDPLTQDEEFLPKGERHWTKRRLDDKLNKIAKVILASCEFKIPDIVGLCEVENREVLEALIEETPLSNLDYRIIHKDSPDERGIDVALIYRTEQLTPIRYNYIPLLNSTGGPDETREILHASFLCMSEDTLHVFFNHWPSRYSGQAETEPLRILAAQTLKKEIEMVNNQEENAKIVIMGDFNDQPQNKSLKESLRGNPERGVELVNLSAAWSPTGTLKYQQSWQIFDQILVSDYLLQPQGLHTTGKEATIVRLPFLFEKDTKYKGSRLFRTYLGYKYKGGFSDHLPIRLRLWLN